MNPDPPTLNAVDRLIERLSSESGSPAVSLLKAVRGFYRTDSDLKAITALAGESVWEAMEPAEERPPREGLEELRSSLNDLLKALIFQNQNPTALIVSENNALTPFAAADPSASSPPSQARGRLKVSEMNFQLPDEMNREFRNQLENARALEKEAEDKLQHLLKKEQQLEEEKTRREKEKSAFRSGLQKQLEDLQNQYEEEKHRSQAEIGRLNEELARSCEETGSLQNEKVRLLTDYENRRNQLEEMFIQREASLRDKFDELVDLIELLRKEETKLHEFQSREIKRARAKQKTLDKTSRQQLKKSEELNAKSRALKAEQKKYKARLEKEFQEKLKELHEDFNRRSAYFQRRLHEEEKEKDWIFKEKETLITKEQTLNVKMKRQADEQVKKRQEELNQMEKEIREREKRLIKEEESLQIEKDNILYQLKSSKGEKYFLEELKTLVDEESKHIRRRKKLSQALDKQRKDRERWKEESVQQTQKEIKDALALLNQERRTVKSEWKKLKDKEQKLVSREIEELKRLNREYEDLKISLESGQIEKEMEFETLRDKLQEKENGLLELEKDQSGQTRELLESIEKLEDQTMEHARVMKETGTELLESQEKVSRFLNRFHETYQEYLNNQSAEFERFKKILAELEGEAEQFKDRLAASHKNASEATAQSLQAVNEKVSQRLALVDELENDLKNRLHEYETSMQEILDAKKEFAGMDRGQREHLLQNLARYEDRLMELGKAFHELSETFQKEKEEGRIEIEPELPATLQYTEDLAVREWAFAVRQIIHSASAAARRPIRADLIGRLAEKWDEWIPVPPGKFHRGRGKGLETAIAQPLLMKKYPVTNIEYYQFVQETGYRTEAENGVTPIVYQKGEALITTVADDVSISHSNPTLGPVKEAFWLMPSGLEGSIQDKPDHPVTQVTWQDALAFCEWKSRITGNTYRLPSESEWEYVARGFGKAHGDRFYWPPEEIKIFCNIEETGFGETTPVDFFPENEFTEGVRDMFGNVYEWMADTGSAVPPAPGGPGRPWARGGSFITPSQQIGPWQRLPFAGNYCTSFLGFRIVREVD